MSGASTILTLSSVGTGQVEAVYSGAVKDTTGVITCVAGEPAYIDVIPGTALVVEEASYGFAAHSRDADSNFVADQTAGCDWSTTDPSGTVSGTGLYTAGIDPSPPLYYVIATLGAFRDSSSVTVLSSGSLRYVRIEWPDTTPVADTTLTTDDDGTVFYCRAYDSADSLLGEAPAIWSVIGADSIGTAVPGPETYTNLTLFRTGTGQVTALYGGGIADTTGILTCLPGVPSMLSISPDTATVSAGSTVQFSTATFDADGNPSTAVTISTWDVLGVIGAISPTGLFNATAVGVGYVTCSGDGLSDTTGTLVVTPGQLAAISVMPDSVDVALGSTVQFEAQGTDAYGNLTDVGELAWDVIGGIGHIDASGIFTAEAVGSGRVAAASSIGGIADTNRVVSVLPNSLAMMFVTPDTASVRVAGSVKFDAIGFDSGFAPAEVGQVVWEVIGGIGDIDTDGNFVATTAGIGYIAATSSIAGMSDTTNMIIVEIPTISEVPIGNIAVHANQAYAPLLAFTLSNAFEGPETVEGISVRSASRGSGTSEQVLSNIDILSVYVDANGNRRLDPSDTKLEETSTVSPVVTFSFSPIVVGPGSKRTFFVSARIGSHPHDGDSLDLFLLPSADIEMGGGTTVAGPDTVNSLGCAILDGMVAEQLSLVPTGTSTINPAAGMAHVLTVDVPRNGYDVDVLEIFSVFNTGTADSADLDALVLYADNGNGMWDGGGTEARLGALNFTGSQWEISGLAFDLTAQTTRLYLAAGLSPTSTNGATLALGLPLHGVEMGSDNDGPIDMVVTPVETISISTSELLSVRTVAIPGHALIPGETTGPILALEFVNGYESPVGIAGLRFTLLATDPDGATQQELDSQIESLRLWLNKDGSLTEHGGADSLIASAGIGNGIATFDTDGLTIPAGSGVLGVFLECTLDGYNAKNGNTINLVLETPSDITLAQPIDVSGDFPLLNVETFEIVIFPAANVEVHTVYGATLYGGEIDCLVFDFELPPNGYADDQLKSLLIAQEGSMASNDALAAVSLWADSGPEGYDGGDILLGDFEETADGWHLSNLAYPIGDGHRFFVTIDVANADFGGGTILLTIPVGGVEYLSGADGPDDQSVGNPFSHLIFPANSITVIPIPMEAAAVNPGAVDAQILTFALYNGYQDQPQTLTSVRFANRSVSASSADYADYELGQVSFYHDRNANRIFDEDSLLASGYFTSGMLNLSGLGAVLPAESLSYFFVTANLPFGAIDRDTLAIAVEGHSDLTFSRTVNVNGDFPVLRGEPLTVDGSVLGQYTPVAVGARTLSPGEEAVTVFAFRPASNGDLVDTLNSVVIQNAGDAGPDEIISLELWLDTNGDGLWQPDDLILTEGTYSDSSWMFEGVGLALEGGAATLLVVGDVGESPRPNSVFKAVIPVNGCQYASANDGPVDGHLCSVEAFVISTSGLKITYDPIRPRYTVGQTAHIQADVTNLLPIQLDSVFCEITTLKGSEPLSPDVTRLGPKPLEAGGTATFSTSYVATQPGTVFWEMQAFSAGMAESSATVQTQPTTVQTAPTGVKVEIVSSIPTSVTRGQAQVFPMSLRYRHVDSTPLAASVRLDSLRLRVEDGSGLPQPADRFLSRIVLATGYTNLAIVESVPSTAAVLLEFSEPMMLSPMGQQVLSLQVDVDSLAELGSFALVIENAEAMKFVDDNTDVLVAIDPATHFPLKTASCRVTNASQQLAVSYVPILPQAVNYGQQRVGVMKLVLRHPGSTDDSQIQFAGLSFGFVDGDGNPVIAEEIFDEIRILRQQTLIGIPTGSDLHAGLVTSRFTAPPVLSPGQVDTVRIEISVRPQTDHADFRLSIHDSTLFTVRDLSSGAMIETVSDPESSLQGPVFPMITGVAQIKYPALPPEICLVSKLPPSVIAGSDSVALVEIAVRCPSGYQRSPILLESVRASVLDTLGTIIYPDKLFDRIGFRIDGGSVTYETSIELKAGQTVFHIGQGGTLIEPGDDMTVILVADIEPDAPFDHFVMEIREDGGLDIVDATDRNRDPGLIGGPDCEDVFPFSTGPTEIFLPAGSPVLKVEGLPVQMASPGQAGVMFMSGEIAYNSSVPQGDLLMKQWRGQTMMRTRDGLEAIPAGDVFESFHLLVDTELVGSDTLLTSDSLRIYVSGEYVLERGSVRTVSLVCDLRPGARLGNYVVRFGDSTFIEFEDRDLGTPIYTDLAGGAYPILSAELTVSAGQLASSFVNWPNPFNPKSEMTNIGFILAEDAYVDIEIFTLTGDLVASVAADSFRGAGPHYDEDTWAGLNGAGHIVQPGTYFCRITARYGSGRTEEVRRKLAVMR
jgi:hypothetical protein